MRFINRCDICFIFSFIFSLIILQHLCLTIDSIETHSVNESEVNQEEIEQLDRLKLEESSSDHPSIESPPAAFESNYEKTPNHNKTSQPEIDIEALVRTQLGLGPSKWATLVSSEHDMNTAMLGSHQNSYLHQTIEEGSLFEAGQTNQVKPTDSGPHSNHRYEFPTTTVDPMTTSSDGSNKFGAISSDFSNGIPSIPSRDVPNHLKYLYRLRGPITDGKKVASRDQTFGDRFRVQLPTTTQKPPKPQLASRFKFNRINDTSVKPHPILAFSNDQLSRQKNQDSRLEHLSSTPMPARDAERRAEIPSGFVDYPNPMFLQGQGIPSDDPETGDNSTHSIVKVFQDISRGLKQPTNYSNANDSLESIPRLNETSSHKGYNLTGRSDPSHFQHQRVSSTVEPLTLNIHKKVYGKRPTNTDVVTTPSTYYTSKAPMVSSTPLTTSSPPMTTLASSTSAVTTALKASDGNDIPIFASPSATGTFPAHHHHLHSHIHSIKSPVIPLPTSIHNRQDSLKAYQGIMAAAAAAAAVVASNKSRATRKTSTVIPIQNDRPIWQLPIMPSTSNLSRLKMSPVQSNIQTVPYAFDSPRINLHKNNRPKPGGSRGAQQASSFWVNVVESANRAIRHLAGATGASANHSNQHSDGSHMDLTNGLLDTQASYLSDQFLNALPLISDEDQTGDGLYHSDSSFGNFGSSSEQQAFNQRYPQGQTLSDTILSQYDHNSEFPAFLEALLPILAAESSDSQQFNDYLPMKSMTQLDRNQVQQKNIDWDQPNITDMYHGSSLKKFSGYRQPFNYEPDENDNEEVIFAPLGGGSDILVPIYTGVQKSRQSRRNRATLNSLDGYSMGSSSNLFNIMDPPDFGLSLTGLTGSSSMIHDLSRPTDKPGNSVINAIKSLYNHHPEYHNSSDGLEKIKPMDFAISHYMSDHGRLVRDLVHPAINELKHPTNQVAKDIQLDSSQSLSSSGNQGFQPVVPNQFLQGQTYQHGNGHLPNFSNFHQIHQAAIMKANAQHGQFNDLTNNLGFKFSHKKLQWSRPKGNTKRGHSNHHDSLHVPEDVESVPATHVIEMLPNIQFYAPQASRDTSPSHWQPVFIGTENDQNRDFRLRPHHETNDQNDIATSESARVGVGVVHRKWSFLASFWPVLVVMPIVIVLAVAIQLILAAPLMVFALITMLLARLALLFLGPLAMRSDFDINDKSDDLVHKHLMQDLRLANSSSLTNLIGLLSDIEKRLVKVQNIPIANPKNKTSNGKRGKRRKRYAELHQFYRFHRPGSVNFFSRVFADMMKY